MPRRKKLPTVPDIVGTARKEDKMLVQKSNPLQSLSETGMSLAEFKILDVYLSRINSHNPDERFVRFEKGELEKLLGVTKIPQKELDTRLDGLFRTLTIKDFVKRKGFVKIALFEKAEAFQDRNGLWQVDLACTPSAMEYIFNIENIGYLRYRLKNVIDLTSRYSYILYLYLENNRYRKQWSIALDDLKAMLCCTAERYEQFKFFNSDILKKCHKELNEKTNLKYSYAPKRKGRRIAEIEFTVESAFAELKAEDDNQMTLEEISQEEQKQTEDIDYGSELANLLGSAALDNEFSPEQVRVIQDLVINILPKSDNIKRCDYLIQAVHKMNLYETKKHIKDRFLYLQRMLQSEAEKKR